MGQRQDAQDVDGIFKDLVNFDLAERDGEAGEEAPKLIKEQLDFLTLGAVAKSEGGKRCYAKRRLTYNESRDKALRVASALSAGYDICPSKEAMLKLGCKRLCPLAQRLDPTLLEFAPLELASCCQGWRNKKLLEVKKQMETLKRDQFVQQSAEIAQATARELHENPAGFFQQFGIE